MFSTKTLYVRFSRFVPVLVITLSILLMVEVAFRVNNWFYDYEGWESPGLFKKMNEAEKLFDETGRIDLVTMSTSIGRVWDVHQWEEATSGSIVGYNFGYPDQRPERQYFLFKNYVYPNYHPKYVIYGIGAGDTNSNVHGMHPDRPKTGPFWTYRNILALDAKTVLEKITSFAETHCHMFRSRRRARFELQYGELAMEPAAPTIGHGVLAPTVRRQPFGPMELSWGRTTAGLQINDFHNYWIPDDGEIGQLLKLHKFCQKHDIKLAIVEFPTSPYSHTNFDDPVENYGRFLNALDHLEANGAWVLRMGQELKLDNTYYEDQAHMNRWGAQVATDYVYQKVIRKWFPDMATAPALPSPVEVEFSDRVHQGMSEVEVMRLETVRPEAQYAAQLQTIVHRPEDFVLSSTLAAGSYAVEIYAGDGSTTSPELTGDATMELTALNSAGDAIMTMPLDWINTRVGVSYTQAYITVPEESELVLRIKAVGERPVILDSAFVRRRLSDLGDGVIVR